MPSTTSTRVEQAQRAALAQITTLAATLPVPASIHLDEQDGVVVLVSNRADLERWINALDLGRPARERSTRPGKDRATWAPEGMRLFTVVGYLAALPHLTAVSA
ncbi:hypothetical protein [Nocardioides zeae]